MAIPSTTTITTGISYATGAAAEGINIQVPSTADYVERDTKSENEVIFINKKTPLDQPQSIRLARQTIKNVYQNTNVDPNFALPSKTGFSLVMQNQDCVRVTDSTDPTLRMDFPISVHLVIKAPTSEYVTVETLKNEVYALLGDLFRQGSSGNEMVLDELLRGALDAGLAR